MSLVENIPPAGSNTQAKKVLLHVLYWITYVCFFAIIWGSYDYNFSKTFTIELISLPRKLILVYAVIGILMPRLLFKGKVVGFFLRYS